MFGVCVTYVRHIIDSVSLFVATAHQRRTCRVTVYQRPMCYVRATFLSLLWHMCGVLRVSGVFEAFQEYRNASIHEKMCAMFFFPKS